MTTNGRRTFILVVIAVFGLVFLAGVWFFSGQYLSSNDAVEERRAQLESLGYLAGYEEPPAEVGLLVYDGERAYEGVTLVVPAQEIHSFARLLAMDGSVLHSWSKGIREVWPDPPTTRGNGYWRRVYLYPTGDILAQWEYIGLVKLDRDSNVVWSHLGGEHHDMTVGPDGLIYAVAHDKRNVTGKEKPVIEDVIEVLTDDGVEVNRISIPECLLNSEYAYLYTEDDFDEYREAWDPLHTNSVRVLDGRHEHRSPAFRRGNILVSMRTVDAVAVIDPQKRQVVWAVDGAKTGLWRKQHEAVLLPSGSMMVFDNVAGDNCSRVIEFDPLTLNVTWEYRGNETHPFNSPLLGTQQRLPNGNTLITESTQGRAFEVTPEKEIVWEYVNTERVGFDDEKIATLLHAHRFNRSYVDWLAA